MGAQANRPPSIPARQHILETLYFIICNSDFASLSQERYDNIVPNQIGALVEAYSKLKPAHRGVFRFDIPQAEIPILDYDLQPHEPTILIGGIIEFNGDAVIRSSLAVSIAFVTAAASPGSPATTLAETSLNVPSCCIGGCGSAKRIVRRFHFDFQPGERTKPFSHLQYGGKFPEDDQTREWHYCLEHFLEPPRWHSLPMDLALLLDLIIREFATPLSNWTQ
ncbi:MAG: hypothetical protein M1358_25800, partial [Chloroflexi bacterium]|nr:hypothetical protein [Chloroflexota bacterium]